MKNIINKGGNNVMIKYTLSRIRYWFELQSFIIVVFIFLLDKSNLGCIIIFVYKLESIIDFF